MGSDQLWMDSYGFVYSADGKRLLIGTLHVPWTAHVHEYGQLVFSEDPEENEGLMPVVYFWTKDYANRDEETWAFEDEGEYRIDEHGVGYSLDGHRLLFVRDQFKDAEYHLPDGVVTICSMSFASCRQFVTLYIPRSVSLIGDFVFGPGGGKIVTRWRKNSNSLVHVNFYF